MIFWRSMRCQATQLHVEDRGGLNLVDLEQFHQAGAGILDGGRCANQCDDLIECIKGLEITAQDVRALLGFAQPVPRASLDDLDLMGDPVTDELLECQGAGTPSTSASMFAPKVSCSWVCL